MDLLPTTNYKRLQGGARELVCMHTNEPRCQCAKTEQLGERDAVTTTNYDYFKLVVLTRDGVTGRKMLYYVLLLLTTTTKTCGAGGRALPGRAGTPGRGRRRSDNQEDSTSGWVLLKVYKSPDYTSLVRFFTPTFSQQLFSPLHHDRRSRRCREENIRLRYCW